MCNLSAIHHHSNGAGKSIPVLLGLQMTSMSMPLQVSNSPAGAHHAAGAREPRRRLAQPTKRLDNLVHGVPIPYARSLSISENTQTLILDSRTSAHGPESLTYSIRRHVSAGTLHGSAPPGARPGLAWYGPSHTWKVDYLQHASDS